MSDLYEEFPVVDDVTEKAHQRAGRRLFGEVVMHAASNPSPEAAAVRERAEQLGREIAQLLTAQREAVKPPKRTTDYSY